MENFKFHNPTKVIFGKHTISQIGEELSHAGISRVLLLLGSGSVRKNGVYDEVISSLMQHEIEWIECWGVQPNPVLSHANEALEIVRNNDLHAVLAVGGGSVIDEAKAICAGVYSTSIWDIYEGKDKVQSALPLFTILTLSATGSEMNSYSVLTNETDKKKWAMGSQHLYPKVSIIDPRIQMTLPWRQTVNGGVDAISHVMENYFGGVDEESTLSINEALIKTVIKSVDALQINEQDYKGRANLAWAASLALSGLTSCSMRGGEWVVHRIEHGISALFPNVAHAEGLAVLFPAWIKYVNHLKPEIFRRWAENIWNVDTIEGGIETFLNKLKQWKAPVTLGELGVSKADIPAIAENSFLQGEVGKIKSVNYQDMVNILELAL